MTHAKTSAQGRFHISTHAIEQYIRWIKPGMSPSNARRELFVVAHGATLHRTFEDAAELWRAADTRPAPRIMFIVTPGSAGALPVMQTVLRQRRTPPSPNNHRERRRAIRRASHGVDCA